MKRKAIKLGRFRVIPQDFTEGLYALQFDDKGIWITLFISSLLDCQRGLKNYRPDYEF